MKERLLVPLYTQAEVARYIGATTSSVQRWARGYSMAGRTAQEPLITTFRGGRGFTVPFVGIAEAYIVNAFRRAGVSMPRIRATVDSLRNKMSLEHALASERLKTDGAEILWQVGEDRGESVQDNRLVVIRNHQVGFGEVVEAHLKRIDYREGFAGRLTVGSLDQTRVVLDPRINFGQPTIQGHGVRVEDVLSRIRAGEPVADVADDYAVPVDAVSELLNASI